MRAVLIVWLKFTCVCRSLESERVSARTEKNVISHTVYIGRRSWLNREMFYEKLAEKCPRDRGFACVRAPLCTVKN